MDKGLLWVKRIFFWGWIFFLGYLSYESIFVFPLVRDYWGYSNDYLLKTFMIIIGTLSLWNMIKINKIMKQVGDK